MHGETMRRTAISWASAVTPPEALDALSLLALLTRFRTILSGT
jgi:hypothetical protein